MTTINTLTGYGIGNECNKWIQAGYLWDARRSANHLNAFSKCLGYCVYRYDVVKWNYFDEDGKTNGLSLD
jgi:hypothetical protein